MSGGSSASGETRYNWNDDMAPRWNNLLNTAMWQAFSQNPDGSWAPRARTQYGGQRFAGINSDQNEAADYTRNMARMSSSPIGAMDAARGQIEDTLNGVYHNANPYGGTSMNHYAAMTNPYSGEGPAFQSHLQNTLNDVTDSYNRGTAAETTRMFNLANAFGGSAHQQAVANNQAALGKTLGNLADQMRTQQFDKSAGLEESRLNRATQAQEAQYGRGFNAFENERQRQLGAIGAGQNEQGLAYQRIGAMQGLGDFLQGQNQKQLDWNYDQWTQNQNHPYTSIDFLSNLFGRAMGGGGMNTTMYGPSNTGGQAAGGLLALAALLGGPR